jgi:hypothetical protein
VPTSTGVAEQLQAIASALRPLGVRWYVFGAQAVIAAGAIRQTADVDITVDEVDVSALTKALGKARFVLRDDIDGVADLIENHRILPMIHRDTGYQLDVVRAGPGPEQDMLSRLIYRKVGKTLVPFVETNDLLVLKVLAGRGKDLEDVRALLRSRNAEIDPSVVRARLGELGAIIDDSTLVDLFDAQLPPKPKQNKSRGRR